MVTLDATSSRLRSHGATSWVRAKLLVCGPCLSLLFHFSFVLELRILSVCNCYILNEICARTCSRKKSQGLELSLVAFFFAGNL
jgi:hypothetical protein